MISAVLAGKLTIPDFWNDPQKYMEHEWVASPKKWIDPQKEANANKTALESCVKSFKQISAEQGRDWKEQIDDMADVVAYAKEKGVQIEVTKVSRTNPKQTRKKTPMNNQPLQRDFSTASIRAVSDDENSRTFELSFSSEEPVQMWFGTEILDHSSNAMDMSRMQSMGIVLLTTTGTG